MKERPPRYVYMLLSIILAFILSDQSCRKYLESFLGRTKKKKKTTQNKKKKKKKTKNRTLFAATAKEHLMALPSYETVSGVC